MIKFGTLKKPSITRASLIIAALLALGSISTSLSAAPNEPQDRCERGSIGGHNAHRGGPAPLHHLLRQLDLTDVQKDKVFAITYAEIPQMRENRKEHHKLMEELFTASRADQFDDKKVQALADKLAVLEKQKTLEHVRTDAKLYALLTPEQKSKLNDLILKSKQHQADADFPPMDEPVHFKHSPHGYDHARMM